MKYRILRWQIVPDDEMEIELPWPAMILSVAPSRDNSTDIDMWSLAVDGTDRLVRKTLFVAGTGHLRSEDDINGSRFIGTCVTASGLVWHVFEQQQPLTDQLGITPT